VGNVKLLPKVVFNTARKDLTTFNGPCPEQKIIFLGGPGNDMPLGSEDVWREDEGRYFYGGGARGYSSRGGEKRLRRGKLRETRTPNSFCGAQK